jgi:hypothetical protein
MPISCINCKALASLDLQLKYCAGCQSASYCSRACQKEDWMKQHKQICKLLNVGHGDMQVRISTHTDLSLILKKDIEEGRCSLDEDRKRFFLLFEESTLEGSQAAARKMKKIAKRQTKYNQKCMLLHSLRILARFDSDMLSWPNSPLLVLLQFVDPNVLPGHEHEPWREGEKRCAALHLVADLADYSDYSTHRNQLIIAKQLIEHGADVNAVTRPRKETPLHLACCAGVVTNLDFVELLLEEGADPNAPDYLGQTPLMYTVMTAPGAAKFLLKWPTTDADITTQSGGSYLASVRAIVTSSYIALPDHPTYIALPDHPKRVQDQLMLQQWREIQEMLVERGAIDTGIPTFV